MLLAYVDMKMMIDKRKRKLYTLGSGINILTQIYTYKYTHKERGLRICIT